MGDGTIYEYAGEKWKTALRDITIEEYNAIELLNVVRQCRLSGID